MSRNESEVNAVELSDRKKQILKMIIDEYIDSGEPVGSKYLTQHGGLSLSPATVRNEMSELEEMGYLDKPHTSAGRIPSTAGYRFYVEKLMEDYRLNMEELALLNDLTKFKTAETERLIERAGKIMSGITRYASVSLAAKPGCTAIVRFDAVCVSQNSFLLVMITDSGEVRTGIVPSGVPISENDMEKIKTALNDNLVGIPLDGVKIETVFAVEEALGRLRSLASPIIRTAYDASKSGGSDDVRVEGVTNLLEYPEFSDVGSVKSLMEVIERQTGLRELISSPETGTDNDESGAETEHGVHIYIGDESKNPALKDTSIVFCSVPIGGANAVIGVIGPRRMDYKKVVSSLKYFAEELGETPSVGVKEPPKPLPEPKADENAGDNTTRSEDR